MSSEYDLSLAGTNYRVEIKKLDEGGLLIVKVGPESFTCYQPAHRVGSALSAVPDAIPPTRSLRANQ